MRVIMKGLKEFFIKTDKIFMFITILATLYGLLLISSMSRAGSGTGRGFLNTQLISIAIGLIGAMLIALTDYNTIKNYWIYFAVISIALLVYTLFFGWGPNGLEDKAWVSFGSFNLQPSELVKIFFIITFTKHARVLEKSQKIKTFLGVISLLLHAMLPVILVHLQGDDGTALVFIFMFLFMALAIGVQLRYFIVSILGILISLPLIWRYFLDADQKSRFLAILDLDSAVLGKGWQQYQGKISIASGGLTGRGLFQGPRVSSGIVPYQESDFIFTVAGEELGFIGCIFLIMILLALTLRVLRVGYLSKDLAGRCICFGFFGMVLSQTTINVAMCLGLIPVVGITLPFFSSGGSSMICLYLGVGLVESVYINRKVEDKVKVNVKDLQVKKVQF